MGSWRGTAGLIVISISFLAIVSRYGLTIPPPWPPEEAGISLAARQLAEGKGLASPLVAGLVPGAEKKSLVPIVLTKVAYSCWGRIFGFELESLRWFSRILATAVLWLMFFLAVRGGLSEYSSLLIALLTSLDLYFQVTANIVRPEMVTLVALLLSVHCFLNGEKRTPSVWYLASGFFSAISLLSHFLLGLFSGVYMFCRLIRNGRGDHVVLWSVPVLSFCSAWLLFSLDDPDLLIAQSTSLITADLPRSWISVVACVLGFHLIRSDFMPGNSPVWFVVVCLWIVALSRRHLDPFFWPAGLVAWSYLIFFVRSHTWYWGFFTPLGYFLLVHLASRLLRETSRGVVALVSLFLLFWIGYQTQRVLLYLKSLETIESENAMFLRDLSHLVPQGATILSFARPDPFFYFSQWRQDVKIYEWPYTTIPGWRLSQFLNQIDGIVMVQPVFIKELSRFYSPHHVVKRWLLRSAPSAYQPTIFVVRDRVKPWR